MDNLYSGIKLVGFFFACAVTVLAQGQEKKLSSLSEFIEYAKHKSPEYQKIKENLHLDLISTQSLVDMYNWSLSGGVDRSDSETPQTSPFSPIKRKTTSAKLRLQKNSALGITPFVEVSGDDTRIIFPTAGTIGYKTGSIETGVQVDLIKAILNKNAVSVFTELETRKKVAEIAAKIAERDFEYKVSQVFLNYIKSSKELELLDSQCKEYKNLYNISKNRFTRKLIQEKDHLLVEVLYQDCLLSKKRAENNLKVEELQLKKVSGIGDEAEFNFSTTSIPEIKGFEKKEQESLDLKLAREITDAAMLRSKKLKSQSLPEFNFNYSLQSQALDDSFSGSVAKSFEMELLTHNIGLNFNYNFGESARNTEYKKALAEANIEKYELENIKRSQKNDLKNIYINLDYLVLAAKKSNDICELQKRKARLYNKEFKNGRGNIRDLVEAEVAYIRSKEAEIDYKYNLAMKHLDYLKLTAK